MRQPRPALCPVPCPVGTIVTDAGRWAFDILAFLHKRVAEAELLPTVAGLDYALQIGVDPVRHLLSMRARLNARVDPVAGDPAAAMRGLREGAALVSERPSRGVARRIPRTRSRLVELLSSRGRVEIVVEVVESGDAHAAARARAIAG